MGDRATDFGDHRTSHLDVEFDGSNGVRRVWALFNALNHVRRRRAVSTDWADEPAEWSLLNGEERCRRTKIITLPR